MPLKSRYENSKWGMKFQWCDFEITVDPKGTPNRSTFMLDFEGPYPYGGHSHFPTKSGPKLKNNHHNINIVFSSAIDR